LTEDDIMNTKKYTAKLDLKAEGEPGEFVAVFATLNVKDYHGDVTLPGAFQDGQSVIIEGWNHNYTMPAGEGVVKTSDTMAWVDGRFFLDTAVGRENYATVKNLSRAEWSYTFDILDSEPGEFEGERVRFLKSLDVVGVGPVTRGAGVGTQTVVIKSKDKDEPEKPEGEVVTDDKPSGVSPAVKLIEIDILELED
jgi:hypothetical protein